MKTPKISISDLISSPNVAELLDDDNLKEIVTKVIKEFDEDVNSRREWADQADKILKIAKLSIEKKNTPWEGASNVKYPLIPTAVLQFASRTYPEIVRDGKVVQAVSMGNDLDGSRADRADRIGEFMSWQLLVDSPDWEENMDRLLHMYPAVGVAFKKTYYDPIEQRNVSVLCCHDEIVVNDNIPSLASAPRVTHILKQTTNQLISSMRAGIYSEIERDELESSLDLDKDYHELLEQHRWLDLADDGLEQPYVVTVHKKLDKVLRIRARFDPQNIKYNEDDDIVHIEATQYFTDFHCIPRPDGKFHSLGLGTLLLHPNEVINSLVNQLIDAGTANNLQGGIIGADVNFIDGGGVMKIQPGQWLRVRNMTGGSLKDQVVPISYNEPSDTLYKLLELMIEATKDLTSVTDVLTGKQPAQNVPATTIQVLAEEGKKVFTSMQRRLYRSLKAEFAKLFRLNRIFLPQATYFQVLNDPKAILRADFDDHQISVKPVSDPNLSSETQRIAKAQALMQMMGPTPPGLLKPNEVIMRMLKAMDIQSPDALIAPPQAPQPNPEMVKLQNEMQMHKDDCDLKQQDLDLRNRELQAKAGKIDAETDKNKAQAMHLISQAANLHGEHDLRINEQQMDKEQLGIEKYKAVTGHIENMTDAVNNHHDVINKHNANVNTRVKNDAEARNARLDKGSSD